MYLFFTVTAVEIITTTIKVITFLDAIQVVLQKPPLLYLCTEYCTLCYNVRVPGH